MSYVNKEGQLMKIKESSLNKVTCDTVLER